MNDVETIKSRRSDLDGLQTPLAEVLLQHVRQYNAQRILQIGLGSGLNSLYLARALHTRDGTLEVIDDPPCEKASDMITGYQQEFPGEIVRTRVNFPYDNAAKGFIRRDERFDMVFIDFRNNQTWYKIALSLTVANAVLRHKGWVIFTGYGQDVPVEHVWNTLILSDPRYWNHVHVADLAMAQRNDT